jgi:hypothetical protein
VFGIDDAVFPWLDKGKQRSIGDDFFVDGMDNPQLLAHVMRWLELFRLDKVKERTTFTRARDPRRLLQSGLRSRTDRARHGEGARGAEGDQHAPVARGGAVLPVRQEEPELADEFFDAWANGTHAGRMNPISKANRTFAKIMRENPLIRIHDTMRAAVWVLAWNFVVRNKKGAMKDFEWTPIRPFPKIAG